MKALAHPTRHRILRALGADGATVSQLARRLRVHKGNISHHLAVLEGAGLARRGRSRTVRGGTEQYFERAATRLTFPPGDEGSATRAMLMSLADDVQGVDPHLHHRRIRLSPHQADHLRRYLDGLVEGLDPASEREPTHNVLVGVWADRR